MNDTYDRLKHDDWVSSERRYIVWLERLSKSREVKLRDIQWLSELLKECYIEAFNEGFSIGSGFKRKMDAVREEEILSGKKNNEAGKGSQ
jgi:hypothetical protein